MTAKNHILTILAFIIAIALWTWPIAPAMLYFFATVNKDIKWIPSESSE